MNYKILIIILILLIIIYYFYNSDTFIDNQISNYDEVFNTSDQMNCSIFGCSSIRSYNNIEYIGKDKKNNNNIFKFNNILYTNKNDNMLALNEYDENKIKYFEQPIIVPINNNLSLKVKLVFNDYNYIGILTNKYYKQEYLLYEKEFDGDSTLLDKLYLYNLVKIIDNKYEIYYILPPRVKIKKLDTIWISYGSFQLGPLLFN